MIKGLAFLYRETPKTIIINDTTWNYYDIGEGVQTLVIFPDIMGTYESWFQYIPIFAKKYRLIIPFYPKIDNAVEMIDALHKFLQTCGVASFTLIGSSLGGLFAQAYVQKYGKEVDRLLLIGTGSADRVFGSIVSLLFIAGIILPEIAIKYFIYLAALFSLSVQKDTRRVWKRYLKHKIWKVNTKPYVLAWGKCVLQLCFGHTLAAPRTQSWNKPLYLIEATNDFVFNPLTRYSLRLRYPHAITYTLSGANHLLWINRFVEVARILQKFTL